MLSSVCLVSFSAVICLRLLGWVWIFGCQAAVCASCCTSSGDAPGRSVPVNEILLWLFFLCLQSLYLYCFHPWVGTAGGEGAGVSLLVAAVASLFYFWLCLVGWLVGWLGGGAYMFVPCLVSFKRIYQALGGVWMKPVFVKLYVCSCPGQSDPVRR